VAALLYLPANESMLAAPVLLFACTNTKLWHSALPVIFITVPVSLVSMSDILQDKYTMFRNRLDKVYAHRRKKAKQQQVSCYRLYDLDLPEFPFAIDLYQSAEGLHAHVAEYQRNHTLSEAEHGQWLTSSREVISEALSVPVGNIHLKERSVITDRREQYSHFNQTNTTIVVQEHGARFLVNLSDYLDTGLFLDHRPTRVLVREQSLGKCVLNLFAYTGSFSVYAALGGADRVITVDLSNTYLDWAKENFRLNGLPADNDDFIASDVGALLPTLPSQSMDLIVCDPPTFSNSKKMRGVFDVQRDHPALLNQCLRLLKPGGRIYFSTNNRRFKLYDDHIQTDLIADFTRQTTGFDFEGKLNRQCYVLRPGAQPARANPWQQ
jgi:23S rRNA (cytosine1962-C5)-methyltransferase